MKLYTKTGDRGETGLYGADRVSKASSRVEAYGTVDELNSAIGLARAQLHAGELDAQAAALDHDLAYLQNALFDLGADLATREGSRYAEKVSRMDANDVAVLEGLIDRYQEAAPPFRNFVHPGGTTVAAALHLARTVARRAEREVVRLSAEEAMNPQAQIYLNRLSDLLFIMARAENARAGVAEEAWHVKGRR